MAFFHFTHVHFLAAQMSIVSRSNVLRRSIEFLTFRAIGVAPITQLSMRVIKIVAFKGGHLVW